tara:strand:- start:65 stop:1765 length:1701 start_codon:yes stop_codon:yes gene_type:complete
MPDPKWNPPTELNIPDISILTAEIFTEANSVVTDNSTGASLCDSKGVAIETSKQMVTVSNMTAEAANATTDAHAASADFQNTAFNTVMSTDSASGSSQSDVNNESPNWETPHTYINADDKTIITGHSTVNSTTINPFIAGNNIAYVKRGGAEQDLSSQAEGSARKEANHGEVITEDKSHKAVGLRGPMVLTGWGYDTDGLPAPNASLDASDIEMNPVSQNYGKPKNNSPGMPTKPTEFIAGHLKQVSKWKSGPVDLRWDRDRKVWTTAVNKVFLSKATKCILPEAGPDGLNSFNFGVGGNLNIGGRLYRNPCSEQPCNWDSYFPRSSLYPDIEVYDPEDQDWCGGCKIVGRGPTGGGGTTVCDDWSQACVPFYDAVILRSIEHDLGEENSYTNCGDKFNRAGPDPVKRRAGNPCHGWGGAYGPALENINVKIAKDATFTRRAKAILYQKIFIENPLNQGLMIGDSFLSYDTGRKVNYTYIKSDLPTCNTEGLVDKDRTPKPMQVTESIPVHVILQAEFVGVELITRSGCEQGEVTACSRKIFAQGFSTMEDCGPDDDYPQTATGYF